MYVGYYTCAAHKILILCKHGVWVVVRLNRTMRMAFPLVASDALIYDMASHNPINYALILLWLVTIIELGLRLKLMLSI